MNTLVVLGGGLLLAWWLKKPPGPVPAPEPMLGPPGVDPIVGDWPPGGSDVPIGIIPPPGGWAGPPTPITIIPVPSIVVPGPVWPAPPPDTLVIPSPKPIISLITDIVTMPPTPVGVTPLPDWIDPEVPPFSLTDIPGPDTVVGLLDVPAEMLSIQEEVEGLLGVTFDSDTAVLEAIQSLGPEEAESFSMLVADQSGMPLATVKSGLAQLGLIGGPLAVAMGIYTLTQGNVAGVTAIVSGVGVTLTSLASTGAAVTLGMDAAAMATAAGLGAALSWVGGVTALGVLFHTLFNKDGIFSTSKWVSPTPWKSFMAGNAAHTALVGALQSATTLTDLTAIANAQWAPHGELQIGSTMATFGWAGDWDDPPSPEWIKALTIIRTPVLVALGLPWVPDFVHGLWVNGPGETGVVPYNPETSFLLQKKFAGALPNVAAYAGIKAAVQPGGDLWQAYQDELAKKAAYEAANKALADATAAAIAASYGAEAFGPGAP